MKIRKLTRRDKRGAALVEYGLIVAGVALVAAAAVSIFGHKTAQMIGVSAAILPGAQATDNGQIAAGRVISTTDGTTGPITIDTQNLSSLGDNLGVDAEDLVTDPNDQ